jgi:Uma2 family endonuclease
MSTIAASPPRLYTPDDLLTMPDGDRYELVDGRLVEVNMSAKSSLVAGNVTQLLMNHCKPIGLAFVFPEQGYTWFPGKPNRMRKPDVSCIRSDRMTPEQLDEGYLSIPPDLAVEVVSPNDLYDDLEEKLDDYRDAQVPLIWIVTPRNRRVRILRLGQPPVDLGPDDELTGEDILPGFRCHVADLFAGLPAPQTGPPG